MSQEPEMRVTRRVESWARHTGGAIDASVEEQPVYRVLRLLGQMTPLC
jgi:hypothetical protein